MFGDWMVGWSVCNNFLKGQNFHSRRPIGALVIFKTMVWLNFIIFPSKVQIIVDLNNWEYVIFIRKIVIYVSYEGTLKTP